MERKNTNNKILFIYPEKLLPVTVGGAARTLAMMEYFRHAGWRVGLVTLGHSRECEMDLCNRVDQLWSYRPCRYEVAEHNDFSPAKGLLNRRNCYLEEFAGGVAHKFNPIAVIATYVWSARALDQMPPGILKIIDTIDVQHIRASKAELAGGDLSDRNCNRDEEIEALSRADVLLAIQSNEAAIFQEMCPDKKVLCVEHAVDYLEIPARRATVYKLLFVGSNYDPNVRGVKKFLQSAWPRVRKELPQTEFLICGRVCDALPKGIDGVKLQGIVPDLTSYYQTVDIVVNPVPYGTGLSIKSVEALAYGKCLVTTKAVLSCLPNLVNPPFKVASIDAMGEIIIDLLRNPDKRNQFENAAWQFAQERFLPGNVFAKLVRLIMGRVKKIRDWQNE
jgi:glycosyltransferase involved in cell wall biosynthesis